MFQTDTALSTWTFHSDGKLKRVHQVLEWCFPPYCHYVVMLMRKKNGFLAGPLSGWSLHVFRMSGKVFSGTPVSSHTPKMCTWGEGVPPLSPYEWAWMSVSVWVALLWRGLLFRVGPALCPELRGQTSATSNPEEESAGWKVSLLPVFTHLSEMYA